MTLSSEQQQMLRDGLQSLRFGVEKFLPMSGTNSGFYLDYLEQIKAFEDTMKGAVSVELITQDELAECGSD